MRTADDKASGNPFSEQGYLRYRNALMSFFMRRVHNRAEAEDLTHEVMLRVLGSADLTPVRNPEAFLFTVAINLLRDRRRHDCRHGATLSLDVAQPFATETILVEDLSPERVVLGKEALEQVLAALQELGGRTRDIFILFRLEGMKQKDIAVIFGIAQSTVEKHVVKALLHLAARCGAR